MNGILFALLLCGVVVPVATFGESDRKEPPGQTVTATGTLATGVMAIGGETTGVVLRIDRTTSWELELTADLRRKAELLNGQVVTVEGEACVRAGVEVRERRMIRVRRMEPQEKP
jgi:hypothetical protein